MPTSQSTHVPPGPRNRWLNTYRILSAPQEATERWVARYGDPVLVPAINGNVVMISDPALAKVVFAADPAVYKPFAVKAIAPLLGYKSLLILQGEEHRRERKLLMPPFHGSRMRSYGDAIRVATRRHLQAASTAGAVKMHDVAQHISLEVIIRTIFGVEEEERVPVFTAAVRDLVEVLGSIVFFVPALQRTFWGMGPFAKTLQKLARTDALLQEQIDRVRAHGPGEDILSMMVQARFDDGTAMSDAHIKDELRTLLLAGHETTSTVLSWAIDTIHRHPEVRERLLAEVDAGAAGSPVDDAALPYLDAVSKETLRHYPIASEALRELAQPLVLGDYEIPAGYCIGVSIVGIHHRPDLYPDPERFWPERFEQRRFGPHEFLPYGGGHRRCIGAAFADFEMRVALATALREFTFTLQQREPPRPIRRNVAMGPKGGVPVVIGARAAGA